MLSELLRSVQPILARLYAPHEWAHYLSISLWSPNPEIHYSVPQKYWSHPYSPALAQVTGSIPDETEPGKARLAALAPTILYTPLAITVSVFSPFAFYSWGYILLTALFTFWALPSPADLYTARYPSEVVEAGAFDVKAVEVPSRWVIYTSIIGICLSVFIFISPLLLILFVLQ